VQTQQLTLALAVQVLQAQQQQKQVQVLNLGQLLQILLQAAAVLVDFVLLVKKAKAVQVRQVAA
jgi:hypothetical protein